MVLVMNVIFRPTAVDLQTVIAIVSGEQLSSPLSERDDTFGQRSGLEQLKRE